MAPSVQPAGGVTSIDQTLELNGVPRPAWRDRWLSRFLQIEL
jgi:hypothetical protein